MIDFEDFVPRLVGGGFRAAPPKPENLVDALESANQWIAEQNVDVINVETVILPDICDRGGDTKKTSLHPVSGRNQYQFIRVWFKR